MFLAPPASACLLPGAGNGARISRQHRRLKVADIYAQLQRIRGHRAGKLSAEKLSFYLPTLFGKVAGAIWLYLRRPSDTYLGQSSLE